MRELAQHKSGSTGSALLTSLGAHVALWQEVYHTEFHLPGLGHHTFRFSNSWTETGVSTDITVQIRCQKEAVVKS